MAQAPSSRLVSLDEFLSWPEESPTLELIDGVVERKPVGTLRHARAARALARLLESHPATRDGEALLELGKSFPGTPRGNHRVPDISYYRSRDIPTDDRDHPAVPPDLAVEVRSPGQTVRRLEERIAFLLDHGVSTALLVDPERKTITLYQPGTPAKVLQGDEPVVISALDGFSFSPDEIFG